VTLAVGVAEAVGSAGVAEVAKVDEVAEWTTSKLAGQGVIGWQSA
jgi:hypothetical protein